MVRKWGKMSQLPLLASPRRRRPVDKNIIQVGKCAACNLMMGQDDQCFTFRY